ncbi:MarR family winged helix-turn-helix transcriptional regulator [Nocardia bovistercoris]|uniref:MarR family transcriptional regulator n=1 Tax=Nocardia bovistercoris TaxID=2785916 RepID=A0A931IAK0_9NOCA|nr:MarR family transcriptional regulator [Nocardia bovistercoris]MBH0777804.1 MarR family transcriptional regulator [Nocardia bovistercoris]
MVEDADGGLYDPHVRASMAAFTADGETSTLEAAAAVRSAWQAIDRMRARGAQGRGLSAGALDVLARLGIAEDGLSVGELARACAVSSRNITGLVDTLEGDELVERRQDRRDRRSVRVHITQTGRAWLESFREPTQRAMAAVFLGFTPEELARFRHLCLRVVDNQQRIERHLNATEPRQP